MKKRVVKMMALMLSICCVAGCGKTETVQQETVEQTTQQSSEETTQAEEKKEDAAILVVSFGTSYNDSRDITIGAIENAIAEAYPDYDVRRAFTSQIIIDVLKERDNIEIDNVTEALDRAVADGVKELIVQPTHLMNGYEYQDLAAELTDYVDKFEKIIFAEPLLMSDADFEAVVKAVTEKTAAYDDGETAICFMGHGTEADSNAVYATLQEKLTAGGYENYYVGTVEATPSLDDVIAKLEEKGTYKKVVLEPLMVVAGDHANNDMAGEEEDSWKMTLENAGYEVECILEGMGQIEAVQNVYVDHLKAAMEAGKTFTGVEKAKETETTAVLTDGTYAIEVESDSSMFKVEKAELTIAGEEMTAVLTLSGTGYGKLYMGTAEEAGKAEETAYIPFAEDENGMYTYTVPVEALDKPIACAAYSNKKEEWYDRQLTFLSASVKNEAAETVSEKPADGIYQMDVTLGGGSGKSTVVSPATVTVTGDTMVAKIEWSSPNYDYMLVGGEKYLPVNTEGNSVFEIPVAELDVELDVIGDTVAMSTPKEIEYTLTFHADTAKTVE